jgi:hypothetical protein
MVYGLGEEGTEQFNVDTWVDGQVVKRQSVHDPFINTKVVTRLKWWACFMGLFQKSRRTITTEVVVRGTESAERAIMSLDPFELKAQNEAIQRERAAARERWAAQGLDASLNVTGCPGLETGSTRVGA